VPQQSKKQVKIRTKIKPVATIILINFGTTFLTKLYFILKKSKTAPKSRVKILPKLKLDIKDIAIPLISAAIPIMNKNPRKM
jgi:hypothetical protein